MEIAGPKTTTVTGKITMTAKLKSKAWLDNFLATRPMTSLVPNMSRNGLPEPVLTKSPNPFEATIPSWIKQIYRRRVHNKMPGSPRSGCVNQSSSTGDPFFQLKWRT